MKYTIPKEVSFGEQTFVVEKKERMPRFCLGRIHHNSKLIELGTRDALKNPRTDEEMFDTYWHEVVHGILFEMGNDLWNDEAFVSEFADLLVDSMKRAKL